MSLLDVAHANTGRDYTFDNQHDNLQAKLKIDIKDQRVAGTDNAMFLAADQSIGVRFSCHLMGRLRDLGLCGNTGMPSAASTVASAKPKRSNGHRNVMGYRGMASQAFAGWHVDSYTTLMLADYISDARR